MEGGENVKKLVLGLLMCAVPALACERSELHPYDVQTPGGYAWCSPGDFASGGGYACPQPTGTHSYSIKLVKVHKTVNGKPVEGFKAVCLTPQEDPPAVFTQATCWHLQCVPIDVSTCDNNSEMIGH